MDTIDISGYQFDWTPAIISLSLAGLILLGAIFSTIMSRLAWNWDGDEIGGMWFGAVMCSVLVGFVGCGPIGVGLMGNTNLENYQEKMLAEVGYSDVEFTGDKNDEFTASKGGDYFRGVLIEFDDSKYQVVELMKK